MQASSTLSEPAHSPAVQAALPVREVPVQQLQEQVQALRTLVESQQSQIHAMQALVQSQPLVGFITDSPGGMALEGLLLGAVALALGVASLWGSRPVRPGAVRVPLFAQPGGAKPDFSDSMLYLADHEISQGEPVALAAQLHDPHHDAHGATLAHDEGDAELDYYRMALGKQGLSVTPGAGKVDSDRMPLDIPPTETVVSVGNRTASVFSPSIESAEFDQRAAAEEVERVRRYLAQRRADRAQVQAMSAATIPSVVPASTPMAPRALPEADIALDLDPPVPVAPSEMPVSIGVQWDDLVVSTNPPANLSDETRVEVPSLTSAESGLDALDHADFSEGASLLATFTDSELHPNEPDTSLPLDVPAAAATRGDTQDGMLQWDMETLSPSISDTANSVGTVSVNDADHLPPPELPSDHVQLELAIQFRDLGLWGEARERVLEILEQPDTGLHLQARNLLAELALTSPAPLTKTDLQDSWR